MCHSCYRHIRPSLTKAATEKMVYAFISSGLYTYHHNPLYGLPKYLTDKLQRIQNNTVHFMMCTAKYDHIQPVLWSLHWLPVPSRIKYKILLLTYKCINGTTPAYLHQLIKPYQSIHTLHSADQPLLQKGKAHRLMGIVHLWIVHLYCGMHDLPIFLLICDINFYTILNIIYICVFLLSGMGCLNRILHDLPIFLLICDINF